MGSVEQFEFWDTATTIAPTWARFRSSEWNVPDYAYVECEEPPDLDHGIVWAHRLDASPPDLFGEILAVIDHQITHVKYRQPKQKGRKKA